MWLVLMVGLGFWWWLGRSSGGDYKMGVIWDGGIGVVSISLGRRMVNSLEVSGQTQVWVPGGLGWYGADKIKRLLDQEDKRGKAVDIIYYNLGFLPDKVLFLDDFSWDEGVRLMVDMGFFDWLEFRYFREQMIFKEEVIDGDLTQLGWYLDEIMVRDFADSLILNEDLRLTVFNTTGHEGLANFLASRISWAGFSVAGVGGSEEEVSVCKLTYGQGVVGSLGWEVLSSVFDCERQADGALADFEVEIYLGEGFSQMINYGSYVRTF